ncbi:MAG: CPBP family intramembrane glutamic endopeptidase [Candidatus Marinimicrobia bacterium]|nr:CPBP family intramembrane glutamic endopeptidase [Candidatus Neomarinimicrobiota bacterium]
MSRKDPGNYNRLHIRPGQIWNVQGMIQQAVMLGLILAVYSVILILTQRFPGEYGGLENWLQRLHGLFRTEHLLSDMITGALLGFVLSGVLFLLDCAVGYIKGKKVYDWVHRSDFMLPVNREQRKWALAIALSGSMIEEIMFRGFIFLAVMDLWGTWLWAALILSALFGFLHAGLQGFWSTLWIFIVSVLLCYFVVVGKSIYFLILLHMMVNITNLFILPLLAKKFRPRG